MIETIIVKGKETKRIYGRYGRLRDHPNLQIFDKEMAGNSHLIDIRYDDGEMIAGCKFSTAEEIEVIRY